MRLQIQAASRFGYLGSAVPDDASPMKQADTLVDLLDHLGIDRLPVLGGTAGALTAAEFALRHPACCSHLGLLVPAANLTSRDPVEFTLVQRTAVGAVLGSDFAFRALSRLARRQMIRTLLATRSSNRSRPRRNVGRGQFLIRSSRSAERSTVCAATVSGRARPRPRHMKTSPYPR